MHEFLAGHRGQSFCIYGCKMWALKCERGLKALSIVMEVTVGGMAGLSHLTHRDMGNVTMMSGTSLTM